jgi:hypothetical protein
MENLLRDQITELKPWHYAALMQMGTPQWFGLGFIQLKVSPTMRFHFWHPDLNPDGYEEDLHSHRYHFQSQILKGSLENEVYIIDRNVTPDMSVELVSCQEGVRNEILNDASVRHVTTMKLQAGDSYPMDASALHRLKATGKTITRLIRPKDRMFKYATVVRPLNAGPSVCPFTRKIEVPELWKYIEDCIGKSGYHIADIPKGELGEVSKIVEEALELQDAHNQGSKIMSQVELSDLHGAIQAYMTKHHSNLLIDDVKLFQDITARAFKNGYRK